MKLLYNKIINNLGEKANRKVSLKREKNQIRKQKRDEENRVKSLFSKRENIIIR